LIQIFGILKENGKPKNSCTITGQPFGPRPCGLGLAQPGFWPTARHRGARTGCVHGAVTTPGAVRWRSRPGLADRQGVAGKAARVSGRQGHTPDKEAAVGAHLRIVLTVRGGEAVA
jgi:hypothetical protein